MEEKLIGRIVGANMNVREIEVEITKF